MKKLDVTVWTLLVLGGLNWGLVGLFDFDLVARIFGDATILSRLAYILVGLAAVYDIAMAKVIQKRWNLYFKKPAHA